MGCWEWHERFICSICLGTSIPLFDELRLQSWNQSLMSGISFCIAVLNFLHFFVFFVYQLLLQQQFGLLLWSIIWTVLQCIIRTMVMTLNCFNWTKSGYWSSYFRLVPRNLCGPNCNSVIWTVANSTFVNCFSLMYQM